MKNKKRALLVILAATMLLASTVLGTMAWLYDTDNTVDQVFDAGELGVSIKYTDYDATNEEYAEDLEDNELVPGKTFEFAPTVTIDPKSEEAYVRVLVTITDANDLVRLMGSDIDTNAGNDILIPHLYTAGWDASKWTHENINASNINKFYDKTGTGTLVYEFRYFETVKTENTGITLDPVFQSFTLPGKLNNKDIADLADMTVDFTVQAIQAKYVGNVEQAWAAYETQVATNANP